MASRTLVTLALFFCASTALAAAQLENVRTAVHPEYTRVVLDLSAPVEFHVVHEEARHRLILTIPGASLSTSVRQQPFVGTPIYRLEHKSESGVLHLRFELANAVTAKAFFLKPYLHRGNRIVIDLYRPEPQVSGIETAQPAEDAHGKQPAAGDRQDQPPRQGTTRRAKRVSAPVNVSATWQQELADEMGDGGTQKFESLLQPRLDVSFHNGLRLTAIGRVRVDPSSDLGPSESSPDNYSGANGPLLNNEHAEVNLRELYVDGRSGGTLWRIGKQQIVWGEADGIKVMDVVNPQSFREFILDDFDDSRIPLWTVNFEIVTDESGSLQILWIPDTSYHELAEPDSSFAFSSPLYVPQGPTGLPVRLLSPQRPDNVLSDSDAGLRYSGFWRGWDFTVNYLYHYHDLPVLYQGLQIERGRPTAVVAPEYERNHLTGATVSNVFGAFTMRAEVVYNSDTYHLSGDFSKSGIENSTEISSVVGLDWQWEARDTLLSAQWFQSHLLDYERNTVRDKTEHTLSLLYQRDFDYNTWKLEALGLYSLDRKDRWLKLKLGHMLQDNLELWLGGDFFAGDRDGLFGQFYNRDRVVLGLEVGL